MIVRGQDEVGPARFWNVQNFVEDRSGACVRGGGASGASEDCFKEVWGRKGHLPLFRWASGQVLKRLEVQNVFQRAAKEVGLLAERFQITL